MEELYQELMIKTNYDKNPDIQSIVLIGSRVLNTNNNDSDLDLFLITNKNNSYKESILINGIKCDINILSTKDILKSIIKYKFIYNKYYESVLKTGKIMKDEDNSLEYLKNKLEEKIKIKRKHSFKSFQKAFHQYKNSTGKSIEERDYYYFILLEEIRKIFYIQSKSSYLNPCKILDSFNEKDKYIENYCLTLPPQYFIDLYKEAIITKDENCREKIIKDLLSLIKYSSEINTFYSMERESFGFFTEEEIYATIIALNNKKQKVETMLLIKDDYAILSYNNLLEQMVKFYKKLYKNLPKELSVLFEIGIKTKEINEKISVLNAFMNSLTEEFPIDFNNYKKKYIYT